MFISPYLSSANIASHLIFPILSASHPVGYRVHISTGYPPASQFPHPGSVDAGVDIGVCDATSHLHRMEMSLRYLPHARCVSMPDLVRICDPVVSRDLPLARAAPAAPHPATFCARRICRFESGRRGRANGAPRLPPGGGASVSAAAGRICNCSGNVRGPGSAAPIRGLQLRLGLVRPRAPLARRRRRHAYWPAGAPSRIRRAVATGFVASCARAPAPAGGAAVGQLPERPSLHAFRRSAAGARGARLP